MTNVIADSFNIVITILRSVGLYYDPNQSKIIKMLSYFLYFSAVTVCVLVFINLIVEENMEAMQFNQMVVFLVEDAAGCLKVLPFFVKGQRIKECIEFFGSETFAPKNKEEKRIMDECIHVCQRNIKIYAIALLFAEIFWNILPFFEVDRRLPLSVWLPYVPPAGSVIFYAIYFYLVAVALYFGFVLELMEPLIAGLVYHTTSQLKILKHNLRNFVNEEMECKNYPAIVSCERISKTLEHCVVHHTNILHFVAEFENCFSWCVFCQIAATSLGLCFCCIGLTLGSTSSINLGMYIFCYFVMAFQLLFYCHYGTLLYEENNGLINAIYMGPWYSYDVKVRRILLIVMERSKIPVILTAGKIVALTYTTFTSVLKTSYSLITVLNNYD